MTTGPVAQLGAAFSKLRGGAAVPGCAEQRSWTGRVHTPSICLDKITDCIQCSGQLRLKITF